MQEIPVLTMSRTPTAAVAYGRFVGFDGNQIGVVGARALGVAAMPTEPTLGRPIPVNVLGSSKVVTGAAFAVGVAIKSDAAGKAIAQAGAGAITAYALEAAAGLDDIVEVLLVIS